MYNQTDAKVKLLASVCISIREKERAMEKMDKGHAGIAGDGVSARCTQGINPPTRLYRIIQMSCLVFMMVQVVIVVYVVFGRFVLNNTPKWGEEIALLAMVYLSLFSAALAMEDDGHIRMTFVDKFFGKRGLWIRNTLFYILNVSFCIFLVIEGFNLLNLTKSSILPGSRLPVPVLYISVPVSSIGYIFILTKKFIEEVRSWTRTR